MASKLIADFCKVQGFENPTVIINTLTEMNKVFVGRYDWVERKECVTFISKTGHAGNAVKIAFNLIPPINGSEEVHVFTTKSGKKKRLKVIELTSNDFIDNNLKWNDERYKQWDSIYEVLGFTK